MVVIIKYLFYKINIIAFLGKGREWTLNKRVVSKYYSKMWGQKLIKKITCKFSIFCDLKNK